MPTEFDFISKLKHRASKSASSLIPHPSSLQLAIGDDAAIINQTSNLQTVISQDLLIEDIDFRRAWMPLKHLGRALGHKALAVSLSDIAAMGATPRYCLTSIGIPQDVWRTAFVDEFYDSLLSLGQQHNVQLIGGDTSKSPDRIVIDCMVIGEVKTGDAVLRSTAKPGDSIFVSGTLGGASAGLELLEQGKRRSTGRTANKSLLTMDALIDAQLKPSPRVAIGSFLSTDKLASSMIDTSDGLASDLHHICQSSNVGALIEAARLPINKHLNELKLARPPVDFALHGGEDYELLFTVAAVDKDKIPTQLDDVSITEIGVITQVSEGIKIKTGEAVRVLKPEGFTHF